MTYYLPLPHSKPPLSLNDRMHWRPKAKLTAELRQVAAYTARKCQVPPLERAIVTLHYRPRDNRTRDAGNLHATLKPITDGLCDAGVLTKGDGWQYVQERCQIHPAEKGVPAALWLTVEEVTS